MILDTRLKGVIEVSSSKVGFGGREYFEATLVSEDAQTLHIFPG